LWLRFLYIHEKAIVEGNEANEQRIRDSKKRTADLVLQLAQNEEQHQNALTAVIQQQIDLRLQKFKNAIALENLEYIKQQNLLEVFNKSA
jgi:hypothetical protein